MVVAARAQNRATRLLNGGLTRADEEAVDLACGSVRYSRA